MTDINKYSGFLWIIMLAALSLMLVRLIFASSEVMRKKDGCIKACLPAQSMFIDEMCHCRIPNGWGLAR